MVFELLSKLNSILFAKGIDPLAHDYDDQITYLETFEEPADDLIRGFYQYRCQMHLQGKFKSFIFNIGSFFIVLPVLFYYLCKGLSINRKNSSKKYKAIFFCDDSRRDLLPKEVTNKYRDIYSAQWWEFSSGLIRKDLPFIVPLFKRFTWHPFFILKCLVKISAYGAVIRSYSVEAIIVTAEQSYTSSVLTAYCEYNDIKHINVMHGERLFSIRKAFFRFHKCYVWEEFYKNLFIDLRASKTQFVISLPESVLFSGQLNVKKEVDITYYLQGISEEHIKRIKEVMDLLIEQGYNVAIRPHPRFHDINTLKEIFGTIPIEDCSHISVERSLLRTCYAMGLYSTVLYQARKNSIGVIIDDITDVFMYSKLVELRYILSAESTIRLSEVLSNEGMEVLECDKNEK